MKNKIIIIAFACSTLFLGACTGDHNATGGKDTAVNSYKAKDTSKVDTSKGTSADQSASGGASAVKDTAKK